MKPTDGIRDYIRESPMKPPAAASAALRPVALPPRARSSRRLLCVLCALCGCVFAAYPRAADAVIKFVDVAAQSRLTLLNVSGGPAKDYIVDEVGNGAAWFDFDNDGDLD